VGWFLIFSNFRFVLLLSMNELLHGLGRRVEFHELLHTVTLLGNQLYNKQIQHGLTISGYTRG
jgi:hypothetical protein